MDVMLFLCEKGYNKMVIEIAVGRSIFYVEFTCYVVGIGNNI